jgi:hypothetical protein
MSELPQCPKCSHRLTELGFLFSGNRLVPRSVAELKGFSIQGDLLGLQYACPACWTIVLAPVP